MTQDIIDNEKELQLLFQSLKRAKGFHLYLVQGNNPRLRTEILDSLKQLLEHAGITFYRHHLKEPIASFEDLLPPGFSDPEKKEPAEKPRRKTQILANFLCLGTYYFPGVTM